MKYATFYSDFWTMCIHKSNQRWVLKAFIFKLKLLHYFGNQVKSNSHYTHFLASEKVWEERGKKEAKIEFLQIGFWSYSGGSIDATTLDNQSWLSRFGKTTHILVGVGGIASARKGRIEASTLTSFFVLFRFSSWLCKKQE